MAESRTSAEEQDNIIRSTKRVKKDGGESSQSRSVEELEADHSDEWRKSSYRDKVLGASQDTQMGEDNMELDGE